MKQIITTVGTSIFSNFLKTEVAKAYRNKKHSEIFKKSDLDNLDDKSAVEYSKDDFENLEENLKEFWLIGTNKNGKKWSKWENNPSIKNTNASAEIKSICKIVEESEDKEFKVYLLCSDTAIGMSAGYLVKAFFEGYEVDKKTITIEVPKHIAGLQVDDASKFEGEAILDLITKIDSIIRYKEEGKSKEIPRKDIILNISGGYKALLPIMTIVGQLEGVSLNYIYEDSNNLITIGNLPVNFDWDYIYHWELLMRPSSLDYISPVYSALSFLNKVNKLTHQHLHLQSEFKSLILTDEQQNKVIKIGKEEREKKSISTFSLYQKMIEEKAICVKDGKLIPTIIGQLLQKYSKHKQLVNSQKMGSLVELFSYKLFAIERSKRKTKGLPYVLNLEPTFQATKFNETKEGHIVIDELKGKKDAKDIDINLINEDTSAIVLGECKTAWAFIACSKKENYPNQIKARILNQLQINKKQNKCKNIEVLFLVFNFSLFGDLDFNTDYVRSSEILNASIVFKEIEKDIQLKNELGANLLAIKILLFERKLTFTDERKIDWNTFLLNVDDADLNDITIL